MSDTKVNVEQFGRFLIQLGGLYGVDDDGYVINNKVEAEDGILSTDNRISIKIENKSRNLMVMKDIIKDNEAIVINPLNEHITETADSKWIYTYLSTSLARRIILLAKHLYYIIETSKNDQEVVFNADMIKFAAANKNFDSKAVEAIDLLSKKMLGFANVYYNRKTKQAYLRCAVYNAETATEFPQITNKTWKALYTFFGNIFDLGSDVDKARELLDQKYMFASKLINIPKLESILNVYNKIYSQLNNFLLLYESEDPDFVVDMTELGYHIEHLQDYYNKMKWFTGSIQQKENKPASNIPSNIAGSHHSNIPSNPFTKQKTTNLPYLPRDNNQLTFADSTTGIFGQQPSIFNQPFGMGNLNGLGNPRVFH